MRRSLLVFLSAFALGACALPFGPQSTPDSNAPTSAALPTRMIATPAPTAMRFDASPTPDDATAKLPLDSPETIAAAKPAERDQVALAEAFKGIGDIPTVARTTPLDVKVGDIETFWVSDLANNSNYQVIFLFHSLFYPFEIFFFHVHFLQADSPLNVPHHVLVKVSNNFSEQVSRAYAIRSFSRDEPFDFLNFSVNVRNIAHRVRCRVLAQVMEIVGVEVVNGGYPGTVLNDFVDVFGISHRFRTFVMGH